MQPPCASILGHRHGPLPMLAISTRTGRHLLKEAQTAVYNQDTMALASASLALVARLKTAIWTSVRSQRPKLALITDSGTGMVIW